MSAFPDAWTCGQQFGAGVLPLLILPAVAGLCHVIDAISLVIQWNGSQLAGVLVPEIYQYGYNVPAIQLPPVVVPPGVAGEFGSDRSDSDGLNFSIGSSLAITSQAHAVVPANCAAWLITKGHAV